MGRGISSHDGSVTGGGVEPSHGGKEAEKVFVLPVEWNVCGVYRRMDRAMEKNERAIEGVLCNSLGRMGRR